MTTLAEQAQNVLLREEAAKEMRKQLRAWEKQGLVSRGWHVTLEDGDEKQYLATFHITGATYAHTDIPWERFTVYAAGFNDRRTALMHRTPRPAKKRKTASRV